VELQRNVEGNFPVRIAYVWAMVFVGICIYAMFWFMFGWAAFSVIEAVEAGYTFTGQASFVVELLKNVIAYHPLLAMVGWLLWGYINSQRRDERAYERY